MSFPKYPEYKDSKVHWLRQVPRHWGVRRFRYIFEESLEKISTEVIGEMLSVSGYRGIEVRRYDDENRRRTEEELVGYRVVRPGQLVVNTMWLNYAGLGVSEHEGHVSPAYRSYKIHPALEKRFIHHLMRSEIYVKGYTQLLTGIRPNSLQMGRDDLMIFPVLIPPSEEQTQIARFLDRETARIDALIEAQQHLIELLKEKRQAVISHAVTKGLDPTVRMKDSGVEWLGKVPAHWEVTKFKWALQTASGGTPPSNDRDAYYDGGIPWLRSLDLTDHLVSEFEVTVTQRAVDETSCRIVPKDSVLIAMYGGDGTIGKNGLLTFDSAINQAICAFLPSTRCMPDYLHRYIQFYRPYWMIGAESSRKDPNIGQDRIGDHFLLLPPFNEQAEIVSVVNSDLSIFLALVENAHAGVLLLQERRSALISAAVTGKIDVRGWQPPEGAHAAVVEPHENRAEATV